MTQTHRLRIMGRDIQVRSAAPPEQVKEVEEYINAKIEETEPMVKGSDSVMTAILVLLNLAESHLSLLRGCRERESRENEKILKLLGQIDSV